MPWSVHGETRALKRIVAVEIGQLQYKFPNWKASNSASKENKKDFHFGQFGQVDTWNNPFRLK